MLKRLDELEKKSARLGGIQNVPSLAKLEKTNPIVEEKEPEKTPKKDP